jgi:stage II sporulation protein D
VRPLDNGAKDTWFEGNLEVVAHDDKLVLINEAGLEEYVTGVIEAEVGMHSHKEFLKVQAIICRTYAVSNYNRHRKEGYDLCDLVHCQVYRGKSRRNPNAVIAVQRTSGKVVADHQNKPIISAFHSNCGGQTINSEDMWPAPMPYLRSVRDSFCLSSPNCRWQAKIPAKSWTKYVGTYDSVGILKADTVRDYSHDMPFKTQLYNYKGVSIPFKKVRTDWNLKSCFFSIRQENDTLFLSGKGYGHGIGLCQEGAMRMAALGYAYQDIINFYYQNVRIISLSELLKQ